MEQKYVTWHGPAGIYALNGPALSAAERRGWKKGPDTFSPSQMAGTKPDEEKAGIPHGVPPFLFLGTATAGSDLEMTVLFRFAH